MERTYAAPGEREREREGGGERNFYDIGILYIIMFSITYHYVVYYYIL